MSTIIKKVYRQRHSKESKFQQEINVANSQKVTIIQADGDVNINSHSPAPKKKPASELLDKLAKRYDEELKEWLK